MLFLTKRVKHDFLEACEHIQQGSFRLRTPEGEVFDFGQGSPQAEMTIRDWSVVTAIAARGDIGFGETYVAGLWDTPSIMDLATVALHNFEIGQLGQKRALCLQPQRSQRPRRRRQLGGRTAQRSRADRGRRDERGHGST